MNVTAREATESTLAGLLIQSAMVERQTPSSSAADCAYISQLVQDWLLCDAAARPARSAFLDHLATVDKLYTADGQLRRDEDEDEDGDEENARWLAERWAYTR